MIALARQRAEQQGLQGIRFIAADAQTHAFEPASFDKLVSRFGVMFFDDPERAMTNLRRATQPGGTLCAAVWRSAAENPFMTAAEPAAAPLIALPPRKPGGPGQFAWADPARVTQILEAAGWRDVAHTPFDFECTLPEPELMQYVRHMGAVGVALQDAEPALRERVVAAVRAAFEPFMKDGVARFTAACAMVTARA